MPFLFKKLFHQRTEVIPLQVAHCGIADFLSVEHCSRRRKHIRRRLKSVTELSEAETERVLGAAEDDEPTS